MAKKKGFLTGAGAAVGASRAADLAANWNARAAVPISLGQNSALEAGAGAFPVGATPGITAGVSGATQVIPALGQAYAAFDLIKRGIQSGTFNHYMHPGTNMPSDYQRGTVNAAVDASKDQPGSPVSTPAGDRALPEGWNIPLVGDKFLTPYQMTKLAKGQSIGKKTDNPVWLNPTSGKIEYQFTTTTQDGMTTVIDNKNNKVTTYNAEGSIISKGPWTPPANGSGIGTGSGGSSGEVDQTTVDEPSPGTGPKPGDENVPTPGTAPTAPDWGLLTSLFGNVAKQLSGKKQTAQGGSFIPMYNQPNYYKPTQNQDLRKSLIYALLSRGKYGR